LIVSTTIMVLPIITNLEVRFYNEFNGCQVLR
jgi:hypothetical protein